jgi:hypothetical protein
MEELKHRTEEQIATIPEHVTRWVMQSLGEGLEQYLRNVGRYVKEEI